MLDNEKFVIVHSDQRSRLVTSDVQTDIIHELDMGDCTLATLSERLDMPQSTVFVNLTKMMESGLVVVGTDVSGNFKAYSSNFRILFSSKQPSELNIDMFKDTLDKIVNDPRRYFENCAFYIHYEFESLGVDSFRMMKYLGQDLAIGFVEKFKGKSADELLEILCNTYLPFDSKVNIVSYMPLTLKVKSNFSNSVVRSHVVQGTYEGFFDTLFSTLLNAECKVACTSVGSAEVDLEYSVRPISSPPPPHATKGRP